ncbi:MAG: galactokinase [Acidimicrobiia bacterium]|nr:MAG: galactokinase [Acidimicrobiia bacterium]
MTDARVRAPGRVNLVGDHTDYQDGYCLPVAIDREVTIGWRPRRDGRVVVRSGGLPGAVDLAADGSGDPGDGWGRTVAAVLAVLAARGRPPVGFDADVSSTVPVGAGLSSSAAFEVACALAAAAAAHFDIGGTDLALAMQEAEQRATGVPCGVMDQMASVHGRAGHALLLDCRALTVEPVPLPASVAVAVVHSGLPRRLEHSEYAARRSACEAAAARLGLAALRDATPDLVASDPVARHVVSENARVLAAAEALRRGDGDAFGALMLDSHRSLRDDLRVSTPELDLLVDLAMEHGALGARLTGAGFGGCVVLLAPHDSAAAVARAAAERYHALTGLEPMAFAVRAVDGAGVLQGS